MCLLFRFVPQGWMKAYAWSEADLEAGCELVVKQAQSQDNSWETDRGLLDVAVYGGLLQDEYDMRILRAILRHIWSKDVLTGRRKLAGGLLNVPKHSGNLSSLVDKLEDVDSVQVYFGLPANAHRAWEKSAAEIALAHLSALSKAPRVVSASSSSSASTARTISELKEAMDRHLQEKLNRANDRNEEDDPLRRLFADELEECRRSLDKLRSDLDNLDKISSSLPKYQLTLNALMARGSSLVRLLKRNDKKEGSVLRVDLSWLSKPDALLAALKLHTARKRNWDFDKLVLKTEWTDSPGDDSGSSVVIDNLLLTGEITIIIIDLSYSIILAQKLLHSGLYSEYKNRFFKFSDQ